MLALTDEDVDKFPMVADMDVLNRRPFYCVAAFLVTGSYAGTLLLTQDLRNLNLKSVFFSLAVTLLVNLVFWIVFMEKLWKLRVFQQWLVKVPYIEGDWLAVVRPGQCEGQPGEPSLTNITIDQSFSEIRVHIYVKKAKTVVVPAYFSKAGDSKRYQLIYSHEHRPDGDVGEGSFPLRSVVVLDCNDRNGSILAGQYCTNAKETGSITLRRLSRLPEERVALL